MQDLIYIKRVMKSPESLRFILVHINISSLPLYHYFNGKNGIKSGKNSNIDN